MAALLEQQQELLVEIVDAVRAAHPDNPQLRVTTGGRTGARVFLHGRQKRELGGRRPHADIEELRAQGYLRRVRRETGNEFLAVTPAAHAERDRIARAAGSPSTSKQRPAGPPPEFESAVPLLDRLDQRAHVSRTSVDALLDVSMVVDRFEEGSGVVTGDPWKWAPIDPAGRVLLGDAREQLEAWLALSGRVLMNSAPEHLDEFEERAQLLRTVVIRSTSSDGPPAGDVPTVRGYVHASFDRQLELIRELPNAHRPSATLVVPDTNALIADPDIERWVIPEPATIVVPAQVVAELDAKKNDPKIGAKATGLIKRFKEYGRRGNTLTGVKLQKGRDFRELALQPSMSGLPMLDRNHADDRILAAAIELSEREIASRVVVVTRDRNMFNKARLLELAAADVADM